jgi:hypothetical protein
MAAFGTSRDVIGHWAAGVASALVVVSAAGGLSGCMAYRGDSVPPVNLLTAAPPTKPVVVYEVKANSTVQSAKHLGEVVEKALLDGLRQVGADPQPIGTSADPDLSMVVTVASKGSIHNQFFSGVLAWFFFPFVPAYSADDYSLSATVISRSGAKRDYDYADTVKSWTSIFLLPWTGGRWPPDVRRSLIEDLARSPLRDMQTEGLLPR